MPPRSPRLDAAVARASAALAASAARVASRHVSGMAWAEWVGRIALDPWQRELIDAPDTTPEGTGEQIAVVCARQVGKSSTTALKAAGIIRRGGRAVVVAPTQRQSGMLFRSIRDHLVADGLSLDRETATEVETSAGGVGLCLPGDRPSAIRGVTLVHDGPSALIVDEAAFVKPALWPVISPMRAAAPSAGLILLSTPSGPAGELYRVWSEGGEEWRRVRVRAEECPRISPAFLCSERARLGDALYRQEYEAEFVAARRSIFDAEALEAMFGAPSLDAPAEAEALEMLARDQARLKAAADHAARYDTQKRRGAA